MKDVDEVEA